MKLAIAWIGALAGCAAPIAPEPFDASSEPVETGCPPTLPPGGSACAASPSSACEYGVTECAGSASPAHRRCVCDDGGWACACTTM